MKQFKLKPAEARVILDTDAKNFDATTKRLLQKVVDKRPLSEEEKGELEGIMAAHKLHEDVTSLSKDRGDGEGNGMPEPMAAGQVARKIDQRLNHKWTDPVRLYQAAEENEELWDRRRVVMEMRSQHPPVSLNKIAEKLGIDHATVRRDILQSRRRYASVLGQKFTLQMLGRTVDQYDVILGRAMSMIDQFSSPMAKAAFLRTAVSALDSKTRLMTETGIIQRVPERTEMLVAHANIGSVRERVQNLMIALKERNAPAAEKNVTDDDDIEELEQQDAGAAPETPGETA